MAFVVSKDSESGSSSMQARVRGSIPALGLSIALAAGPGCATAVEIGVDCDELASKPRREESVVMAVGQSLTLTLCSNASTGFRWNEEAMISDASVLAQSDAQFFAPAAPVPGAPGKQRWAFRALKEGSASVRLEYRQPWVEGGPPEWLVELSVRVEQSR
jgi:inhibitor of cysteine peptidase